MPTVTTYLANYGVGIEHLAPSAPPDSVITRPARAYELVTRGGSNATVLIYRSPNKALRARSSAGPLTVLGDNVLVIVERRGSDIHRVLRAITAIGDCRIAKPCQPRH
jgi:hypothetical protein